jgi:glutathione S-transferase
VYTVIGTPRSRAIRVVWALEEIGVPYEWRPALPRSEEALAHNPSGKVPVLLVDGTALLDSVAIVQFIADRHGALTHPAGSLERAVQDGFTQFAVEEVDGPLWLAAKHSFVLPEAERLAEAKPFARREFARAMETLATRLGDRPFVTGEAFTVPDLVLGHCAGWAERAGFALPDGPVGAYLARMRERPALRRAMEAAARL